MPTTQATLSSVTPVTVALTKIRCVSETTPASVVIESCSTARNFELVRPERRLTLRLSEYFIQAVLDALAEFR